MSYNQKIKTYIGFAVKARKIKFGIDEILKIKKPNLILVSNTISQNSKSKLESCLKNNCIILYFESNEFCNYTNNENIKILAITDKNLADAIKNEYV